VILWNSSSSQRTFPSESSTDHFSAELPSVHLDGGEVNEAANPRSRAEMGAAEQGKRSARHVLGVSD
jgi:hypothetical protein